MKKIFCALLALLVLVPLPAVASYPNPVMDGAQVLGEAQAGEIARSLEALRDEYGINIVILTESVMRYNGAEETAEYYYDLYCGEDGILLYLSGSPREYWFVTYGRGKAVFSSRGIARLEDVVVPYLQENAYYEAFTAFAEEAETMLAMAAEGKAYNAPDTKMIIYTVLAVLLLPLFVAFIMTKAKIGQMKTAAPDRYASNYIKDGSFRLNVSRDIFLYSTLIKTPKPKASSGSGAGRRHGGGGGRY